MFVVAATLLAPGCDTAPPPEPSLPRAALTDAPARAPDRGKVRGGQKVMRAVRWPADSARDPQVYGALDEQSRAAVDASPVPVLLPNGPLSFERQQVMRGPQWYAFSGARHGVTVSVQASGQARVYPGVKPVPGSHTLRDQEAFVSRNEGIWAASWIEHGVAYDVSLECAPVDDPPCNDEHTLVALVEGLVYVGGDEGARR